MGEADKIFSNFQLSVSSLQELGVQPVSKHAPSTCEAVGGLQHQKDTISQNKDPFHPFPNVHRSLLRSAGTEQLTV